MLGLFKTQKIIQNLTNSGNITSDNTEIPHKTNYSLRLHPRWFTLHGPTVIQTLTYLNRIDDINPTTNTMDPRILK